jgi:hypothetical protein
MFENKIKENSILIAKVKNHNTKSQNFFYKNNFHLLKKNKNILTFYKIHNIEKKKYLETIDKIENIRKNNNINWMNILRIAFKYASIESSEIFREIFIDDRKINKLSKKLF